MKLIYRGCRSSHIIDRVHNLKPDGLVDVVFSDCEKETGPVRLEFTSSVSEEVWSGVRMGRELAMFKESERGLRSVSANESQMVYVPVNEGAAAILVMDGISMKSGGTGRLQGSYSDGTCKGSWVVQLAMSKQTIVLGG